MSVSKDLLAEVKQRASLEQVEAERRVLEQEIGWLEGRAAKVTDPDEHSSAVGELRQKQQKDFERRAQAGEFAKSNPLTGKKPPGRKPHSA